MAKLTEEVDDIKLLEKAWRPEVEIESYGDMKTYKINKKDTINEIFIMQDLSPRILNISAETKFKRNCGVSKVIEQEEF